MKSIKPWVNALNVPQEQYQRWCETMPANSSITYWCLANGYISPGEYLQWAQEHYGLATLRPEFFENQPDKKVFEVLKSVANWSSEMIPVCEWDGVVFVACVEPVEEVRWSFPVQYVLASSSELQGYWESLHAATKVTAMLPENTGLTPYPVTPTMPPPVVTMAPAMQTTPPPAPMNTKSFVIGEDAPGGLNLNIPTARKERDFLAELASAVPPEDEIPTQIKPMPVTAHDDMPAGMSFNTTTAMPPMPEHTFTAIKVEVSAAAPVVAVAAAPAAPSAAPAAPTPIAGVSAISEQGKLFGGQFFRDMQSEFEGSMILLGDSSRLTPWSWDEAFAPQDHKGPFVDLGKPSAFRIAFRTKMPYLGHVVETPTNQEFFNGWGYKQMPESIIAFPLSHAETFYGVLLMKAKKNQKQSHLLVSSEQFATRITHALAQLKIKAA